MSTPRKSRSALPQAHPGDLLDRGHDGVEALHVARLRVGADVGFRRFQPAGNCLNWVVGHLVAIYGRVLPLLGQEPALDPGEAARYDRGSEPLADPAAALPLERLLDAWDEASRRFDAGLAALAPEAMDRPAPFSPSGDPDETVRSLLVTVVFHQGYHSGQTGILRRVAGREGAIR